MNNLKIKMIKTSRNQFKVNKKKKLTFNHPQTNLQVRFFHQNHLKNKNKGVLVNPGAQMGLIQSAKLLRLSNLKISYKHSLFLKSKGKVSEKTGLKVLKSFSKKRMTLKLILLQKRKKFKLVRICNFFHQNTLLIQKPCQIVFLNKKMKFLTLKHSHLPNKTKL